MTLWTRLVWDTLATMLEEGTEDCDITDNPMTISCTGSKRRMPPPKKERLKAELHAKMLPTINDPDLTLEEFLQIERTKRGVFIRLLLPEDDEETESKEERPSRSQGQVTFYSGQPYSHLGHSMASFGDGGLAIGAPGYLAEKGSHLQGCVFLVPDVTLFSGDVPVEMAAAGQVRCDEEEAYSLFGQSVALADVDGDGEDDLIVGASESGESTLYSGGA